MDMLFPEPATFNFPTRTLQEVVQDNALELCSLLLTICVSHLQTLGNLLGNEGCKIWVVCCASFGELALYADVLVTTSRRESQRQIHAPAVERACDGAIQRHTGQCVPQKVQSSANKSKLRATPSSRAKAAPEVQVHRADRRTTVLPGI